MYEYVSKFNKDTKRKSVCETRKEKAKINFP